MTTKRPEPRPADTLTPRERAVMGLVLGGLSNREVAAELGIAVQTVKNHLREIFDKLGVDSRVELIVLRLKLEPSATELLRMRDGIQRAVKQLVEAAETEITGGKL